MSSPIEYVAGSQLDFRVTVMIGYKYNTIYGSLAGIYIQGPVWGVSVIERSDWSSVKQFTIPSSLPSPTVTLPPVNSEGNSQPQSPDNSDALTSEQIQVGGFSLLEFSLMIILCTTLPVLIIALIYTRKTARHKP